MTAGPAVSSPEREPAAAAGPLRDDGLAAGALGIVLALGAALLALAFVMSVNHGSPLPPPFPSLGNPSQNQDAENTVYIFSFLVAVPVGVLGSWWASRTAASGPGPAAISTVAALLAAALAGAVLILRVCGALDLGDGVTGLLAAMLIWWALAGGALVALARAPAAERLAGLRTPVWVAAGVLALGAVLTVTRTGSVRPLGLVAGAVIVAIAVALRGRFSVGRGWGLALDALVLVLVVLLVPDLDVFKVTPGDLNAGIAVGIAQFHQDFLLGPANQVLHGGAMLVDTSSQYGVASIDALAGAFKVIPLGYGTLGLIDAGITALWFAAGFVILRAARTPRTVAALAMALAIVALIFHMVYPVGYLVQDGPFRFGLPMAVVLALVVAARWPGGARWWRIAGAAVVGLAAIWSLEGFVYSLAVFAVMTVATAWLRPEGMRLRWLGGQALLVAGCCVLAHLIFLLATLAATGHAPEWGVYLHYLKEFLTGGLGTLTYDVARWNAGLAVSAAYVASAVATIELVRRRGAVAREEFALVTALVGVTAYGIVLLSYWVNRSADHILVHISLPILLCGALWVGLLLRRGPGLPVLVRRGGLLAAAVIAVLLVGAAWPTVGDRFPSSMLAQAFPGGRGLSDNLHRLWHLPPLKVQSPEGARLLAKDMPGQTHSLVIAVPGLQSEILYRAGRADPLLLGDPLEASLVASAELPRLRDRLALLKPGDRMLLDAAGRRALAAALAHPELDPLKTDQANRLNTAGVASTTLLPRDLAPIQQWALRWISQRFALKTVDHDAQGFAVLQLGPRR